MNSSKFTISMKDSTKIFIYRWSPEEKVNVKGVVQIAHGMAEHGARYESFAEVLVDEGFAVYASDHRGHGKTAGSKEEIGYFADTKGWNKVVDDMQELTTTIKKENPDLPVFIFGHSMGSFLLRNYIYLYGDLIHGAILSGTGGDPGVLGNLAILISKLEIIRIGKKGRTKLMNKLTFGSFNKHFKPNRTEFDWLSRDEEVVDNYINDPFCGKIFTAGFYKDMMFGLKQINQKSNILKTPKDLPIFLFSGDMDPVGSNGKGVIQVYNAYNSMGMRDVSYKLFHGGRHEMLNETNREEVFQDIISWINKRL
ncbi:MAG: alpha/beta hydrolase [Desulfobacterales bacterium]|jgi:alpha-beta hydrolase superfamily lysophospholipase|nr:alpha/beta hydrolase [Desulfobacteraceae bacterium]MBT4363988.1 alpha/beta hydrolase [Desulfobacteraceae bacterium]MBT7086219.1 alpha/beta hydrolase [Desulfobacterales bacterium]MBT7696929.1 alpha/beta hydrolase [Desulfobacterales bacterium]